MLEENGRVIAAAKDGVLVETSRRSACDSCTSRSGCGQRVLAEGLASGVRVLARNPRALALQSGDEVVLGIEEHALLTASALLYLVPVLALMVAALAGQALGLSDGLLLVCALGALAASLWTVRHYGPRDQAGCRYQPQILRKSS